MRIIMSNGIPKDLAFGLNVSGPLIDERLLRGPNARVTILTGDGYVDVHPETVEEYTNRDDKNGNKIFTGNTVGWRSPRNGEYMQGKVIFNETFLGYFVNDEEGNVFPLYEIKDIEIVKKREGSGECLRDNKAQIINITKRERYLLKESLEHSIHRYLIVNTKGREDGAERARHHLKISETLVKYILAKDVDDTPPIKAVHDFLAEVLTDRMNDVIGFPIHENIIGTEAYDMLADRFFDVIIKNIDKIGQIVMEAIKNG